MSVIILENIYINTKRGRQTEGEQERERVIKQFFFPLVCYEVSQRPYSIRN